MDLGTIFGLVIGFGLVALAMILGGGVMPFVDAQSALIVIGGTLAATMINQRLPYVVSGLKTAVQAFIDRSSPKADLVPLIVELAAKARKEGLVALEGEQIDDPFMARGVRLGVDGLSPELISETLQSELASIKQRHERGQQIFKFMSATAPSMGLIGTIIGLVQMLQNLDDPRPTPCPPRRGPRRLRRKLGALGRRAFDSNAAPGHLSCFRFRRRGVFARACAGGSPQAGGTRLKSWNARLFLLQTCTNNAQEDLSRTDR